MGEIYFIADLHLGHSNILKYESAKRPFDTIQQHDEWIEAQWNSVVRSDEDIVYVLGDVAFNGKPERLSNMRGRKILILGTHDILYLKHLAPYFTGVYPFMFKYGASITHIPIHPMSLRGKPNIHGHIHSKVVCDEKGEVDRRYINVSVEQLDGKPISLTELQKLSYLRREVEDGDQSPDA